MIKMYGPYNIVDEIFPDDHDWMQMIIAKKEGVIPYLILSPDLRFGDSAYKFVAFGDPLDLPVISAFGNEMNVCQKAIDMGYNIFTIPQ